MRTPESAPRVHANARRIPDFFFVGHPKCGTTALYEMLRHHPQIFLPEVKEMRFFASDIRSRAEEAGAPGRTLEEHLSLFDDAPPGASVGEMSAVYLFSRTAAAEIHALAPDARIIACLREPASFLRSIHLQRLQNRVESEKSLRRAIELEPERRQGHHIPRGSTMALQTEYSELVRYVEQLRRYHAVFPPERVLVLIYDDFRADNAATLRQILRFLELDERYVPEPLEANPTVGLRSGRLEDLNRSLRAGRGPLMRMLRDTGRALTSQRLRARIYHPAMRRARYAEPPPPDEQLMRELRERFKPEVQQLGEYLGRDLMALWGYDRSG